MARSAEKAMTALARWRAVYVDKVHETRRRPRLATECDNLKDAEHFRRQLVNEISRKVAQIQNPSLGEFKLRDVNDEINKLVREKGHWELRISELGGTDYKKHGPKILDRSGKEVPGSRGYRYFGAARDLPGVRELFEADPQPPPRKTRGELMKHVDVDYYGYRHEDDGVVLPQEEKLEKEVLARKKAEWLARRELMSKGLPVKRSHSDDEEDKNIYDVGPNPADEEIMKMYEEDDIEEDDVEKESESARVVSSLFGGDTGSLVTTKALVAHVPVPSQKQIEQALLQRRKQELLQKYMSDDLAAEVAETRELMGMGDDEVDNVHTEVIDEEEVQNDTEEIQNDTEEVQNDEEEVQNDEEEVQNDAEDVQNAEEEETDVA